MKCTTAFYLYLNPTLEFYYFIFNGKWVLIGPCAQMLLQTPVGLTSDHICHGCSVGKEVQGSAVYLFSSDVAGGEVGGWQDDGLCNYI